MSEEPSELWSPSALSQKYNKMGTAFRKNHQLEEALNYYNEAINVDPSNCLAWSNKAKVLEDMDQLSDAIKCYKKAIELNPNNASSWNNLGYVLRKQQKYTYAMQCYKEAIRLQNNNHNAWYNMGYILDKQGKYEEAYACFVNAVRIQPDNEKYIASKNATKVSWNEFQKLFASLPEDETKQETGPPKHPSTAPVMELIGAKEPSPLSDAQTLLAADRASRDALGSSGHGTNNSENNEEFLTASISSKLSLQTPLFKSAASNDSDGSDWDFFKQNRSANQFGALHEVEPLDVERGRISHANHSQKTRSHSPSKNSTSLVQNSNSTLSVVTNSTACSHPMENEPNVLPSLDPCKNLQKNASLASLSESEVTSYSISPAVNLKSADSKLNFKHNQESLETDADKLAGRCSRSCSVSSGNTANNRLHGDGSIHNVSVNSNEKENDELAIIGALRLHLATLDTVQDLQRLESRIEEYLNEVAQKKASLRLEQKGYSEKKCAVCWEHIAEMICIPCGHLCLCQGCKSKLRQKRCPICTQPVKNIYKVWK
ncbi:histone demethylase UTY-like [Schistocerca gregaria]|uniref:histone demethylase UTY-like n=1 Tax=Schistocerca gregaria TaxID=7010 RepID=UPI00211E757D|nr:histone demethylase UTY-like [Schistocerca gregaria]